MSFLKRIFKTADNASSARFGYPFFRDREIQNEISHKGYAVRPLLSIDDVQALNSDFSKLLEMLGEPLPDTHWTSGRVEDVAIRNFARQSIHKILPKSLEQYFDSNVVDFVGGIFLAKKPSATSELTAHQDSSHTDETKYPAIYAWVALTDTDATNGAMHILPGSHLWGNRYRSLNVPWAYKGFEALLTEQLIPVHMKAGEVLFFDSEAIHYSANNLSSNIRPAVNYFIKPKEALFLHHYIGDSTPEGKVEVYNVDIDFFYNMDFMKPPPCPPYRKLGEETTIEKLTLKRMEKLISDRKL